MHEKLPQIKIPDNICITSDLKKSVVEADLIIVATPSNCVRETANKIKEFINPKQIICCVSKGIEPDTLFFMDQVISSEIGTDNPIVALSGPTHAEEVAADKLSLIVSASTDQEAAKVVQEVFIDTCIRTYTNNDIKGVELCGALKNIIALACGMSAGLGYGDNTKAAIITRGITEINKLGAKMGCLKETFSGLAGIGDLIVTATSEHSRNNKAGQYIGAGLDPNEAVKKVGMVVEGINALPAAIELSEKYDIELPIINAVNDIINNNKSPKTAVKALFTRDLKSEITVM